MKVKKIKIKSSLGKNISAIIHGAKMKSQKLAILCPGYLDSKDYDHLVSLAEKLSEQGYTAVRFDPTGTWESEGDISEYTATQYLADVKSVLEYMLKQGDYEHILLGGHSRGGTVAMLYAARDPQISIVLAIMSGSPKGQADEEWKKKGFRVSLRDLPEENDRTREFRVPYLHAKNWDEYDVLKDIKKIKVPIILIAGELDDKTLPEDVEEVFDKANEPKKFILIPGLIHDYRRSKQEIDLVDKTILNVLSES